MGVSPSGYYDWLKRDKSLRQQKNESLVREIWRVHFESRQAYGALKTWRELRQRGICCGKHRVARLRRLHGIETRRGKRFKVAAASSNEQWFVPNLLNRRFQAESPNQVWVGDITFLATRKGALYLAILLDLYSRKVIGWTLAERADKQLVLDTLEMALDRRRRETEVLHHTDRGSIYASYEYIERLKRNRLIPSMSRKGNCYDNAVAESFFSTLKNELVAGDLFESKEQARTEVFSYIEGFYNRRRLHQSLNYITPEMKESLTLT